MEKTIFSLGLLAALVTTVPMPSVAQTMSRNLSCNATIALGNGTSFVYAVVGSIELEGAGRPVPPTSRSSGLVMTVQQRDRNGRLQTLLHRAPLENWEQIAPDADYSRLPFSGNFRGKPNDGRGLYSSLGSAHGLYASLRPVDELPQQLQVVHYLSPGGIGAGQFVRPGASRCRSAS
ncbi:MAG: hypothetical protein HC771_04645 [Synechococcales cyanobacterium CRU_2_2]|nr:hypothetical protein [Synechococcales cyanobacterium CRU_2_2]